MREFLPMDAAEMFFSLLVLAPILIPIFVVTLKKLLTTKVPKQISVDNYGNMLVTYNKTTGDAIHFDNLAYSHSNLDGNAISITFYKSFVGTRGQIVDKKVVQVIGMKWTRSWSRNQIIDIINYLTELKVKKKVSANERLSLFDKLSS
jgi:hypothetical protein